jgi:FRG domain
MLRGQWFFQGDNTGEAILELDRIGEQLVGTATLFDNDASLPATYANIIAPSNAPSFSQHVHVFAIDRNSGRPVHWETIASQYPGVSMSKFADTRWDLQGDTLHVSWATDIGRRGTATLRRGSPEAESNRIPLSRVTGWREFKQYVLGLDAHRYIFRGQSQKRRLRTYFHRTGRADLRRFVNADVNALYNSLTGLTTHVFNLDKPVEYGAFLTLVQHHGYPTPLLDWTRSPFVAAYFAYSRLPKEDRSPDHRVRIFVFDETQWISDFPQFQWIIPAALVSS